MLALLAHEQITKLLKRRNLLNGFLGSPHILNTAMIILFAYQPFAIRRTLQRRIMEHDNDIVRCDMHVAFNALAAVFHGALKGGDGVFWESTRGASVPPAFGHGGRRAFVSG